MSTSTSIEWTDATWNPVRGCTRVSAGCVHCYAETMAARFSDPGMWGHGFAKRMKAGGRWTGKVELIDEKLNKPLRWKKSRRIFVNSTSDLWHESLSTEDIMRVYTVMTMAFRHTFQVLTKRPERRCQFRRTCYLGGWRPAENIWEGTSIESADHLDRLEHLRQTPAAVRFLSLEPLLGPLGQLDLDGIHWVIVGGESGHGARPMHPDWAREIRDQCRDQGVPFFFKQWGAWGPTSVNMTTGQPTVRSFDTFQKWTQKGPTWIRPGDVCLDMKGRICRIGGDMMRARDEDAFPVVTLRRAGKKAAGAVLDGREWREFPQTKETQCDT